jgi:hypothetical protein
MTTYKTINMLNSDPLIIFLESIKNNILSNNNIIDDFYTQNIQTYINTMFYYDCFECCTCIDNNVDEKNKYKNNIEIYLRQIAKILNDNGFNVENDPKYHSEFIMNITNSTNKLYEIKCIHSDNDLIIDDKVCTLVIYLENNCYEVNSNINGNIEIYELNKTINCFEPDKNFNLVHTIDTHPTENSKKIVMFDGDVYHSPQNILNGTRVAVICQISIKKK